MKIINTILAKKIFLIGFFLYSITGFSQQFTVSLANGSNPTPTTFEVDIILTVIAPAAGIRLASVSTGVNYNPAILNGGTPCTTAMCGSWAYVGGKSPAIAALLATNNTNRAAPVGHLRTVMPNLTAATAIDIPPGVYTVGRYRFTNTVPFTTNSNAQLWLQPTNTNPLGSTNTIVSFYPFGQINPLDAYTTTAPGGSGLILPNTQTTPFSLPLNQIICATSASFTQTPVTCFGGNNGTATITMSPVPSSSAITYTVDGGASITGTLVAGAFTISGLTAGSHTVVVTGSGTCGTPVTVSNVIVGGPSGPLTNTTNVTACNSYTWPVTGIAYTTSGPVTGTTVNGSGCTVNETLNLTINSSTTGTTNATACDTYTWAAPLGNGLTYTTNQTGITFVSTNAAGCPHTQTLNLTINNSTSATTTATACNTYTWALPLGNGLTYTTSQTGITNVTTNAAGCPNTQTLNLTINNSTTGTTNATACDTYTWAAPIGNGLTYTTNQTGITNVSTNAAGCTLTQTLNLTINSSTTGTTNATACNTYTWAGPLGNGLTYTTSQTGITFVSTNAAGCPHTQTLNLTINNSTSATTTATACNTYTWALPLGNGLTYTTSQTGITNVTTNAAGCPNTQTLNLTINNSTTGTTNATACDTYTWAAPIGNGLTYTTNQTGITNVSTNAAGCTLTQTLNLTINSSTTGTTNATACNTYTWAGPLGNGLTYTTNQTGITFVSTNAAGCPHTQTLNLTINNSTSATTTATACNTYTWALPLGNGLTYTTSQTGITNVTTNAAGCINTQTLNLTINVSTTGTSNITACDTYTWAAPIGNGLTYTTNQTGITNVSTNAAGCTLTQTLNLTINSSTTGTTNATACDTYTWAAPLGNGLTYTTSQTGITFVSTNAAGCPHTQTLNLTINNSTSATTTATACNTYTWALPLGNGLTYTTSQTGITNVTTNAAGCPNTQTLNLTINLSTTGISNITACDTYTWAAPIGNGLTYTTNQTGITNVSTNAAGCTLTQTLNLTINSSTTGTTNATACDTYTWAAPLGNGLTYTTSQTGITFVSTNAAGCPHTQTLNLTINNSTSATTTATACDTYTWALPLGNGLTYTTSQTGITNVTTNAAGCPNTQTLNLTINVSTTGTSNITACDTYTWAAPIGNGLTYTTNQTGITNVSTNAAGCTLTQTLNLTINSSTTGTTNATACDTYTWAAPLGNGLTYTTNQTGITFVSTNAAGCPHTQTLNLTINNSTSATTTATACDTYTWALPLGNGLTYTTSQTGITNVTTNAAGCPNTQTLNLTINVSTTGTSNITACDTYTWAAPIGNGLTYTTNQTGITNVSTNAAGCTLTQTLNLTINSSTTGTTNATACDTYTWTAPLGNGLTYTTNQTGITFVSTNAAGCPHTQTLNLTINNSTSATTTATACDTYTWALPLGNGLTYTTSQTGITNVTTNAAGCPHTQTLNLTINVSTTGTSNITACDTYTWAAPIGNGLTYTTNQTGITNVSTNAAGCTLTQTLNLTINSSTTGTTNATACDTYTWAGPLGNGVTYTTNQTGITFVSTNAAGCPHTQTLNLTINASTSGVTNASACTTYTWAAPLGNGLTYTTNQTGITNISTNAAGCPNTQTLNLLINSTTGTSNITACDTYTWAAPLGNGLTYTTNQTGITFVSTNSLGCPNTQTLNLIINSSSSGTTTATRCDTYTWPLPLGNGLTYTTSQTGITNVTTNTFGCPHTQTLNLIINNSTTGTTTATACDSYVWAGPLGNGLTYTTSVSGAIKVSTNAAGCLHTQTLNLTINSSTTGTTNAIACNSYTWALPVGNGVTYNSSVFGVTKITTNAAGCTHTQTLNLVINNNTTGTTNASACSTYTWAAPLGNGQTYTTSQTGLTHVSTNISGCLHTQTLNLVINNNTTGTTTATACDTYTWSAPLGNGQTYTTSQTGITNISTNAAGCLHTQTLNLIINNSSSGTTTATACNSYTWALPIGNGNTYNSSVFGVTKITTNAAGCPHTQTLNLTINNSTTGTTNATACTSYTWALPLGNGQTYTTSQNGITNVTTNSVGCTHTQTLNLTINQNSTGITNAIACSTYTWALPLGNGQTYTTSQTGITNISTNAAGCQHTQTLNLIINQNTTNGSVTITANNSYTWAANLVTYTTSGVYTHITTNAAGCINTATLNLTIITVVGTIWYQDADGDGYGNPAVSIIAVIAPPGYVAIGTDCNDSVATINPGASEICYDGIDNDCNGIIDNVGTPGGCIAIVTSLETASCGITISNLNTKIKANYVVGAQGYRFRIRNLTTNVVLVKDRPVNFFTFSSLPGITLNTTYKVDIALLINNVWQPFYGAPCNVVIANPVSTLGAQCGTTLTSMNQWVYATYFSSATGYRFRITNTVTNAVQIKDQVLNRFKFNQLLNSSLSTVYFVEVALRNSNGTYLPYGPGCNITTSANAREDDFNSVVNEFKVIAYPNPFTEDFKFNISTLSVNKIQIRVYDMLGKQIEIRNVEISEIENLKLGSTYPSGVYNVILSQGETTKNLRVIKR